MEGRVSMAMQNDVFEFGKSIFEDNVFSRIQKYLKSIRKSPEIPPVSKNAIKESVSETEQCNMFNDYFICVFDKQTFEMPSTFPTAQQTETNQSYTGTCLEVTCFPERKQVNGI